MAALKRVAEAAWIGEADSAALKVEAATKSAVYRGILGSYLGLSVVAGVAAAASISCLS